MRQEIHLIPVREYYLGGVGSDISDDLLGKFETVESYPSVVSQLTAASTLRSKSTADIIDFFDTLAISWIESGREILSAYADQGISFLLSFMRRANLEPMVKVSMKGSVDFLDRFIQDPSINKQLMAHPRGVVTHWLAGNVPILGMISLLQGLLTKNINVVKLPRRNGLILPSILDHVRRHSTGKVSGEEIIGAIQLLYCDKNDAKSQRAISDQSKVRVAWGGLEAVESVLAIPKKYGVEDVIFGPKYSLCAVGRNSYLKDELDDITAKIALDVSIFDQHGCNSPHVVFVEQGGDVSALEFAEALARGMEKALKRIPKGEITSGEAYSIMEKRSEYALDGRVFSSKGTQWTVIHVEDLRELPTPCFSRVIFVSEVSDLHDIIPMISHRNQTLGLVLEESRKAAFAKSITSAGIERITNIGKMSLYTYPWDGMFPMERFVRWVSVE